MTSDCKRCDCEAEQKKIREDCPSPSRKNRSPSHCPKPPKGGLKDADAVDEYKNKVSAMSDDDKKCWNKRKCMISKYKPSECCKGLTGHHIVPGSAFCSQEVRKAGTTCYDKAAHNGAPVVCAMGWSNHYGTHGRMHDATKEAFSRYGETMNFGQMVTASVTAHANVYTSAGCDPGCMETLLKKYYEDVENNAKDRPCGITTRTDFSTDCFGGAAADADKLAKQMLDQMFLDMLPV